MAGEERGAGACKRGRRLASMRPRLGGRGRAPLTHGVAAREHLASMRPRLGGRGRAIVMVIGAVLLPVRFNEAPARWPGRAQQGQCIVQAETLLQ